MRLLSLALWPDHLVTLGDWDTLPEDTTHRYELVEGTLHVSPRPNVAHQWALSELNHQLRTQFPRHLRALPEVEVVLFDPHPPTVRVPDLIIMPTKANLDVARCAAADVVLACEIVSQGSVRTDRITKRAEYADAGIGHYWLVDLTVSTPCVEVYRLGAGGYERIATHPGPAFTVATPASITIDVDALAR